MTKEEEERILEGTRFKDRDQVAEEVAYYRREEMTTYRNDEGMPPENEMQQFRERFNEVKEIAAKLGITEEEVWDGRKRYDDRVAQIRAQIHQIRRTDWPYCSNSGLRQHPHTG